ncbi:ANTAR domain-containing response regulator [Streptomyces sp. enrichment culture]|uniref:ANTAR domain-containing response regulator n=1 Tax=Streptomyces sp. enrichment culture TaxID=1795815 RepID=UPI003F54FAAB
MSAADVPESESVPRADQQQPGEAAAAQTSGSAHVPPATRRVVIAEDEALIRMDLKEMLEEEGYTVVGEAGDGRRAVELAREHRPDLCILDVKMPELDGISAAEKIAEESIAPVLMLTAFSQRELVERARDAGAMAYLVKPFSKSDVVPAIEMAVSRFAELKELEKEVADLSQRLETRKLVDRAKGVLQTQYGLTEPAAFRWIQKTSMDRRLSMQQVAEAVIADGEERKRQQKQ